MSSKPHLLLCSTCFARISRLMATAAATPHPGTAAAVPGGLPDEAPNFEANNTVSCIRFYDYLGDSWGILFSPPGTLLQCVPLSLAELKAGIRICQEEHKADCPFQ